MIFAINLGLDTSYRENDREVKFLLFCLKNSHNLTDLKIKKEMENLLSQDINWLRLREIAIGHRVMPLLFQILSSNLDKNTPQLISNEIFSSFSKDFQANTFRNLFLMKELLKLLDFLKTYDIKAIPFKGPILAHLAYNNLALRQFNDLDILVSYSNLIETANLIENLGYQLVKKLDWQWIFWHEKGKFNLDIHWEVSPKEFGFNVNYESFWQRLQLFSISGSEVLSFSIEDLLIILCLQGAKDGWEEVVRIYDIAGLIDFHPQINWELVVKLAEELNSEIALLVGLNLAHNFVNSLSLPSFLLMKIEDESRIQSISNRVVKQFFRDNIGDNNNLIKNLEKYLIRLSLKDSFQDTLRDFFYLVITPKEKDKTDLALPRILYPFYYFLRPFRLLLLYKFAWLKSFFK